MEALKNLSPERLRQLRKVATIESISSSARIKGAKLTDMQVETLLSNLSSKPTRYDHYREPYPPTSDYHRRRLIQDASELRPYGESDITREAELPFGGPVILIGQVADIEVEGREPVEHLGRIAEAKIEDDIAVDMQDFLEGVP